MASNPTNSSQGTGSPSQSWFVSNDGAPDTADCSLERVALLVHLLCNLWGTVHHASVKKLRDGTNRVLKRLDKDKPKSVALLEELYHTREAQEAYLRDERGELSLHHNQSTTLIMRRWHRCYQCELATRLAEANGQQEE